TCRLPASLHISQDLGYYDPGLARYVVFAGTNWEEPCGDWITSSSGSLPFTGFNFSAFDTARGRFVVIGANWEDTSADPDTVFEWDRSAWTAISPKGPSPKPRSWPAVTYDARRHRVVLFGGNDQNSAYNDMWQWDGERWSQVIPSGDWPSPRGSATL